MWMLALDSEGPQHLEIDVPTAVQKQALNARQWFPVKKSKSKQTLVQVLAQGPKCTLGYGDFPKSHYSVDHLDSVLIHLHVHSTTFC